MADLEKVYAHILDQYSDVPNWQKYYRVFAELTDELFEAIITWSTGRYLETSAGYWLDICGVRLGLPRPELLRTDGIFTWDSSAFDERWDRGVWSGTDGIPTGSLIADEPYRKLLRGKAIAMFSSGSLYDIYRVLDAAIGKSFSVATTAPRVVTATYTESLTALEVKYAKILAPIQADTDFMINFDIP